MYIWEELQKEYEGTELGDERLNGRLLRVAEAMSIKPDETFPSMMGETELAGAYRFFNNASVEFEDVLFSHMSATAGRCFESKKKVYMVHDTTDFTFSAKRQGLGRIRGSKEQGFLSHVSMAVEVADSGMADPLGVLSVQNWTRGKRVKRSEKVSPRARQKDPRRESVRWYRGVEAARIHLADKPCVHVMDREADMYDLMADMHRDNESWIIRSCVDRRTSEGLKISDMKMGALRLTREVALSRRKAHPIPAAQKNHPPRKSRLATLSIQASCLTLVRPKDLVGDYPSSLSLNMVVVQEKHPPKGQPPVFWRLLTSEPIDTAEDIAAIVDGYRCRWVIEEFFKVLKTGCRIEQRQFDDYHALLNVFAVFIPIAWRALRLRAYSTMKSKTKAHRLLTPDEMFVLGKKSNLQDNASIQDALLAIAKLGGHLKRNGPPGWIVLLRGLHKLQLLCDALQTLR